VTVYLTIGEFSRMTYLSVKALRHYHDVGLLEPADVDATTGYRFYGVAQVPVAQAIRRFRDLDMPIDDVKAVLDAGDTASRNDAIVAHLQRMEQRLEETQATVASLRALLEGGPSVVPIEYRTVAPMLSLAVMGDVSFVDSGQWLHDAFDDLTAALAGSDAEPVGPSGGLYSSEFFEEGIGPAVVFVPIATEVSDRLGRVELYTVPAADLAVVMHHGPLTDLDQSYGRLGTFVAERGIGAPGPIRERYLVAEADDPADLRTEVGWPIDGSHTSGP
jgi:DNA-binding transcriptional MerR regulator